jgi:hypothetical protein
MDKKQTMINIFSSVVFTAKIKPNPNPNPNPNPYGQMPCERVTSIRPTRSPPEEVLTGLQVRT